MIGETGERKSAVATPDGKSRKKKKKKKSLFLIGLLRTVSSGVRRVGRSAAHLLVGRLVYLAFVEGSALLSLCPRIHGVRVHH